MARNHNNILENKWNQEEIDYIGKNVFHITFEDMSEYLGRTVTAIKAKLKVLFKQGKLKKYKRRWTNFEDDFLMENYGNIPMESIEKNIFRTENSILKRLYILFGENSFNLVNGDYTLNDVMSILGRSQTGVRRWVDEGIIPCRRFKSRLGFPNEEFWEWISKEENHKYIKASDVNYDELYHCPEWYRELVNKLKRESYNSFKTGFYSPKEESLAKRMYDKGYSIKEIAKELNRGEAAVRTYFNRLVRKKLNEAKKSS